MKDFCWEKCKKTKILSIQKLHRLLLDRHNLIGRAAAEKFMLRAKIKRERWRWCRQRRKFRVYYWKQLCLQTSAGLGLQKSEWWIQSPRYVITIKRLPDCRAMDGQSSSKPPKHMHQNRQLCNLSIDVGREIHTAETWRHQQAQVSYNCSSPGKMAISEFSAAWKMKCVEALQYVIPPHISWLFDNQINSTLSAQNVILNK